MNITSRIIDCYMCGMALLPRDPYEEQDADFDELPFEGVIPPDVLEKKSAIDVVDLCEEPIIIDTNSNNSVGDLTIEPESEDSEFHDSNEYFLVQQRPPPLVTEATI